MSRTPTSGIATAQTALASQPGYLIAFLVDKVVYRFSTFDVDFIFDDALWASTDVTIDGLTWDTGGAKAGQMTLGDPDLVWWSFALNLRLQYAPIAIWQAYMSAPNEAEPLWFGRVGAVSRGVLSVICALMNDSSILKTPRRRVQNVIPSAFLLPAGKVIDLGSGHFWTLERKQNG